VGKVAADIVEGLQGGLEESVAARVAGEGIEEGPVVARQQKEWAAEAEEDH